MIHKVAIPTVNGLSQKTVLELLKELGGRATVGQISQLAFKKYPEYTLHAYVGDRLRKLANWGIVKHNDDDTWEIVRRGRQNKLGQSRVPG